MRKEKQTEKKFINSLKETEYEALKGIYLHRCLSREQLILWYFIKKGKSRDYAVRKIRSLLTFGCIKAIEGKDCVTYFLTNKGRKILAENCTFDEKFEAKTGRGKITKEGLFTEKDLMLNERLVNHQINLASFALIAEEIGERKGMFFVNDKYVYNFYPESRFDGLLISDEEIIGLEMDMGTEKRPQFERKFECFRNLFKSSEYFEDKRAKKIFFIINSPLYPKRRRRTIIDYLHSFIWDYIGVAAEVYIGKAESLYPYIDAEDEKECHFRLLENTGLNVYEKDVKLRGSVDFTFDFLTKVGGIDTLVDSYYGEPISVLKKIEELGKLSYEYKRNNGCGLNYLVLIEEGKEEDLLKDLKSIGSSPESHLNLLFTTSRRLNSLPLYEAIWRFSYDLKKEHFTDDSFKGTLKE